MPKFPKIPKVRKLPLDIPSLARALGQTESLAASQMTEESRLIGDLTKGLKDDPAVAAYLQEAMKVRPKIPSTMGRDVVTLQDLMQEALTVPGWQAMAPQQQAAAARAAMVEYLKGESAAKTIPGPISRGAYRGRALHEQEGVTPSGLQARQPLPELQAPSEGPQTAPNLQLDMLGKQLRPGELAILQNLVNPQMYPRPNVGQKYIDKTVHKIKKLLGLETAVQPEPEPIDLSRENLLRYVKRPEPGTPPLPPPSRKPRPRATRADPYAEYAEMLPGDRERISAAGSGLAQPAQPPESISDVLQRGFDMVTGMIRKGRGRPADKPPRGQNFTTDYEELRRREFE